MENDDSLRDRLLGQLPQPANLADYRREVALKLEETQKAFRREKIAVRVLWISCVVLSIGFLWFDGSPSAFPKGPWLALFTFSLGAIELLRHFVNRNRIDFLKEIKQVQVQLFELNDLLRKGR
jgi:hypothetical protein